MKFLLIDDDYDDRELFCEALNTNHPEIQCYYAADGEEAIEKLLAGEYEDTSLIFLDINMPLMDGWKCLAIIKEEPMLKDIPVVMYSTSSYQRDMEKAKELGALCFFTKPHSFKALVNILNNIVENLGKHSLEGVMDAVNLPQSE